MSEHPSLRKNPSREACQKVIKRILVTEVLEKGHNEHFRQASDFMSYFQSLYPASDSLNKQVQRAIKAMNMPRDENGYYIINKTTEQLAQEQELSQLFNRGDAFISSLDECKPIFIQTDAPVRSYLIHCLTTAITFQNRFETIVESNNGFIIYTKDRERLLPLLRPLLSSHKVLDDVIPSI